MSQHNPFLTIDQKIVGDTYTSMEAMDNLVLLCDSSLRREMSDMLSRRVWRLPVLAYDEIVPDVRVESVGSVKLVGAEPLEVAAAES